MRGAAAACLAVAALCDGASVSWAQQPLAVDQRAQAALQRFFDAYNKLTTLTYRMRKRELLKNGRLTDEEVLVKLKKPSSIYIAALKPQAGQEVIFVGTRARSTLVAHRGHFPDITVNLDVHGSVATRNQHHFVYHSGFGYAVQNLQRSAHRALTEPHGERVTYEGAASVDGRRAERIAMYSGIRPPRRAVAHNDEPLWVFAERVQMDPYIILCANPSIDGLADELDGGRTYVVPAYYGSKTELVLDVDTGLPLVHTVWDASGRIYEKYEYKNLAVDPKLTDADFDPNNDAYGF